MILAMCLHLLNYCFTLHKVEVKQFNYEDFFFFFPEMHFQGDLQVQTLAILVVL